MQKITGNLRRQGAAVDVISLRSLYQAAERLLPARCNCTGPVTIVRAYDPSLAASATLVLSVLYIFSHSHGRER